jgi:hypothetical protein
MLVQDHFVDQVLSTHQGTHTPTLVFRRYAMSFYDPKLGRAVAVERDWLEKEWRLRQGIDRGDQAKMMCMIVLIHLHSGSHSVKEASHAYRSNVID